MLLGYTGWPPKTEQSIVQDSALISSYLFSPCWIEHLTKIIKFGWELFILWVISYGLSFSGFARFPEFRGTINDSFVFCSVIRVLLNKDHYRVQWQWFTIQARHWHWDFFVAGWMLVCVGACAAEAVINRVSELWKSGKSRKWQSIRYYSLNKKFSTKFDDLGVIIMRKR